MLVILYRIMIGLFDSGSGGLTVLREIKRLAPTADVIYLGDFKNLPYGDKSPEELGALTVLAIERLLQEGAENIVSACNSVSASIAQPIIDLLGREKFGFVEMVGPTVRALASGKEIDSCLLLVATEATIKAKTYHNAFNKESKTIQAIAIPELVPAIESEQDREMILGVIRKALTRADGFDVLILGCTQYPIVERLFEKVIAEKGISATVFNPGEAVAKEAVKRFGSSGTGAIRFLITAPSAFFEKKVKDDFEGEFPVTIEII